MKTAAFDLPPALLALLGENRPATPPQDTQTDTRAYSSPTPWENPAEGRETPHSETSTREGAEMTRNRAFYQQIYTDILTIYGRGLGEPEPLGIELDRTRQQLHHLQEAQERETDQDSLEGIAAAIRAHRAKIKALEERIAAA